MARYIALAGSLTLLLSALVGCQTAPLGGTHWNVIEIVEPDAEDRAALADMDTITVEFTNDGRLITTVVENDGTAAIEDDERYRIEGDVITITHPDYTMRAMYRFEGDQLRLHSPKFIMLMNPVVED
jgi:hypothetical protein